MSKATVVKEAVKETLLGSDEPTQLSAQSRARFINNAVKDPDTGELYMGPDEFINTIAPQNEDYVSRRPCAAAKVTRADGRICAGSTRSSGNSTRSCSASPITRGPAGSA